MQFMQDHVARNQRIFYSLSANQQTPREAYHVLCKAAGSFPKWRFCIFQVRAKAIPQISMTPLLPSTGRSNSRRSPRTSPDTLTSSTEVSENFSATSIFLQLSVYSKTAGFARFSLTLFMPHLTERGVFLIDTV